MAATDRIRLRLLGAADAPEAGALLAASHAHYPAFRHLWPDPGTRARVLLPFMTAAAGDATIHARCYAAEDHEELLGVALWMPPGTFPLSAARKVRMTGAMLHVALAAPRTFPAFARSGGLLERSHPPEPAWYLQALGVHPRAQRRGVGSMLMTPALDQADAAGTACTLHTSDPGNIPYYERFGFEVTHPRVEVSADGPAYIGMRRPPRSPG